MNRAAAFQASTEGSMLPAWRVENGQTTCDGDPQLPFIAFMFQAFNGFDLPSFDTWLNSYPECVAKTELIKRRLDAIAAAKANNDEGKKRHLEFLHNQKRHLSLDDTLRPLAIKAIQFQPRGRGKGTIRKAVLRLLKKNQLLTNEQLWEAIKAKPPKEWVVRENRLGRYLEGPENRKLTRTSFNNTCTNARKDLVP